MDRNDAPQQPPTVSLPDAMLPPAAMAPTDIISLRVIGTDIEIVLDRRHPFWLVGRAPSSDIRFENDVHMSWSHAVIHNANPALVLHDRSTKRATFVNGQRCRSAYLHEGTILQLGSTRMVATSENTRNVRIPYEKLAGDSPAIEALRKALVRVARLRSHVLIVGALGSGRRTVAQAIHQESENATGPFVEVDCCALTEAERFPAVTIAVKNATRGSVLIRSPELLAGSERKLAKLVEKANKNDGFLRFLFTTSDSASLEGRRWKWLHDSSAMIGVPPLWERTLDIAALITLFARELGYPPNLKLPTLDVAALAGRHWEGEVEELRRTVRVAFAQSDAELDLSRMWPSEAERDNDLRIAITRALEQADSRKEAAEGLGIPRTTFNRLVQRLGL